MSEKLDKQLREYETQNREQTISEHDDFTERRYRQFHQHLPRGAKRILDVGCNTGIGGVVLRSLSSDLSIVGLDCVQARLDRLPPAYNDRIHGLSSEIPSEDAAFDVVLAGEFLEHLYPRDVDATLCEFQRILRIGGRLIMTTPNPGYLKNRLFGKSVYSTAHLTQHAIANLRWRLIDHGFARVAIRGSGRVSTLFGQHIPWRAVYGSYLIWADKI